MLRFLNVGMEMSLVRTYLIIIEMHFEKTFDFTFI